MKNDPPSLSVSIVVYQSPVELLRATINSLYISSLKALNDGYLVELILTVIDNSQNRGYSGHLRDVLNELELSGFFQLKYVEAEDNIGFGAGHNLALLSLDSDYHLILNPDVEVAESALSAGLSALQFDPELVLLSPLVTGSAGEQEFLCKSYPSVVVLLLRAFAPAFIRDRFRSLLDRYEMREVCKVSRQADVMLASGCFMLTRSAALVEVGGFSDKYFLYFEDFDLSLRLRNTGRVVFHPAMQIIHHGGYAASKGRRHIWLFIKSGIRFFNDHGWKWI